MAELKQGCFQKILNSWQGFNLTTVILRIVRHSGLYLIVIQNMIYIFRLCLYPCWKCESVKQLWSRTHSVTGRQWGG